MNRPISRLIRAAVLATIVSSVARSTHVDAAPARQAASPCVVEGRLSARPDVLLLGEATTVDLNVRSACPRDGAPLHVVFVLDGSGSMAGMHQTEQRLAVESILTHDLRLAEGSTDRAGIVAFNSVATTLCQLTGVLPKVRACVRKISANGGSAIDRGIVEGLKVLAQGRVGLPQGIVPIEALIVFNDGGMEGGCPMLQATGRMAKLRGVFVAFGAHGDRYDAECLRASSTWPGHVYPQPDAGELATVIDGLRSGGLAVGLKRLTVSYEIGTDLALVAGSARPPATTVSANGRVLTWELHGLPAAGISVRLDLRPTRSGSLAVGRSATAELTDILDHVATMSLPIPSVTAFGGR